MQTISRRRDRNLLVWAVNIHKGIVARAELDGEPGWSYSISLHFFQHWHVALMSLLASKGMTCFICISKVLVYFLHSNTKPLLFGDKVYLFPYPQIPVSTGQQNTASQPKTFSIRKYFPLHQKHVIYLPVSVSG